MNGIIVFYRKEYNQFSMNFRLNYITFLGKFFTVVFLVWFGRKFCQLKTSLVNGYSILLRPNSKNLNRVTEPPKTDSNWAQAIFLKHWIQFQVEPILFKPRLKFETWLKFFKVGLCMYFCGNAYFTAPFHNKNFSFVIIWFSENVITDKIFALQMSLHQKLQFYDEKSDCGNLFYL